MESKGASGVFFLGSAHLSNEESFLLRKIADHVACPNRDCVVDKVEGGRQCRIKAQKEWVEGDEEAPNHRGSKDMGMAPGAGGYGLDAVLSGKASPEVIVVADAGFSRIADDPKTVAALRKARFLAVAGRNSNALTRAADVVLPAASMAEREGTFTNVQGRVQKFERAFLPRPPVRPVLELIAMLGRMLGYGDGSQTPPSVLTQIAAEIPAYGNIKPAELEGGRLLRKGDFVWGVEP
jgi:predicted molibdopterin-dependent oxidoreductase YjgC